MTQYSSFRGGAFRQWKGGISAGLPVSSKAAFPSIYLESTFENVVTTVLPERDKGIIHGAPGKLFQNWSSGIGTTLTKSATDGFGIIAEKSLFGTAIVTSTDTFNSLVRISRISIILSVQRQTDGGMGTASASDVSGTWVPFNIPFIDIDYITLNPRSGNNAYRWYFDFNDVPNPLGFYVFFFDNVGNRVSGPFSWSAGGK